MQYVESEYLKITEKVSEKEKKKIEKPVLKNGTIVYCKGHSGALSFYGIVYEYGVLELPYASNAYINTTEYLHIGDTISYWTIEGVCDSELIIKGIKGVE